MPPQKKASKRNRDPVGPPTTHKTHSDTMANVRDAIVAFTAGFGSFPFPSSGALPDIYSRRDCSPSVVSMTPMSW